MCGSLLLRETYVNKDTSIFGTHVVRLKEGLIAVVQEIFVFLFEVRERVGSGGILFSKKRYIHK